MHEIPYNAHINFDSGVIDDAQVTERRLSDMAAFYHDQEAVQRLLDDDPVLYRVYYIAQEAGSPSLWNTGVSVIEPGRVGDEYIMTKGHYHLNPEAPEVYLTLSGTGRLVLQTRQGEAKVLAMTPGAMNYIPGEWAHRTVNVGDEPLVFFAVWPSDAGYDYDTIAERGFARLVIAGDDGPQLIDNPAFIPES
jgi:glucose-6-phosphate isomerase